MEMVAVSGCRKQAAFSEPSLSVKFSTATQRPLCTFSRTSLRATLSLKSANTLR